MEQPGSSTCKICSETFLPENGEPYHTEAGLLCRKCADKEGLECRCKLHRIYRNDPGTAGALAAALAGVRFG